MRIRIAQALLALCIIAAATAPAAQGYRLGGKRWPGKTITYYNGTPYKAEVSAAVRTWNASGMKMRFRATSRAKARVRILFGGRPLCFARAQLGYVRKRTALMWLGKGCTRSTVMTGVATHEFGHILGLQHEDRGCAAMNTLLGQACGPKPDWTALCRYLETDDVAGAVRRYGGTVKPVSPVRDCPLFAPPQPPAGFTLAASPARAIVATATIAEPARLYADEYPLIWSQLHVWRYPNACPPEAGTGEPHYRLNTAYGPQSTLVYTNSARGVWCYAMAVSDGMGRRSPAAQAAVVVP